MDRDGNEEVRRRTGVESELSSTVDHAECAEMVWTYGDNE